MKRWNGWGEESITYRLPAPAVAYLAAQIGPGEPIPDATLEETLRGVPASRLCAHPLISSDPTERLRHARGQSLPDWIALRGGRISAFPDGVAYPESDADIRALFDYARKTGARLIPYGGGTSVVGHINPLPGEAPVLTLDLRPMNRLLNLDEVSRLATFEAGARGPEIERQLEARGFTLGHFPQSFEYSTLGGWIATRSSGQQSHYYGRIEDLFAGGHLETPAGPLDLPPHPASAAGPDLRHLVLGSEGRLGILTRAIVRLHPKPQHETFQACVFHDWDSGLAAVRRLAQDGLPLSMARLSDAQETETTLALSGKERLLTWLNRGLQLARYGSGRCLLIVAFTCETGGEKRWREARHAAGEIARRHGGLWVGTPIGEAWRKTRFRTPYLRNTLWELGYALDTLETAVAWAKVRETAAGLRSVLRDTLEGERVLAFAHLSHIYPSGASVYVTFLFRRCPDPDETLERWRQLKHAASQYILAQGGTISHQHGVGLDHAPYLGAEKGALGLRMLHAVRASLDPQGLLNRGKLLEE